VSDADPNALATFIIGLAIVGLVLVQFFPAD
jgi:hypothetical protein